MQHSPVPTGGQGGWSDASVTVGFKDLNVCFVCMDVCAHACLVQKPEEGVEFPVTGVTDGLKLPSRCQHLN